MGGGAAPPGRGRVRQEGGSAGRLPGRTAGHAVNLPAVVLAAELEQEVRAINQGLSSYDKFIKQMKPRAQRAVACASLGLWGDKVRSC